MSVRAEDSAGSEAFRPRADYARGVPGGPGGSGRGREKPSGQTNPRRA